MIPKPIRRKRLTENLTAKDIQYALNREFRVAGKMYFNNHDIAGWSESDVFMISDAMVSTEIEIKISHSDFQADYKKVVHVGPNWLEMKKHDALTKGIGKYTPTKFAFACPAGLISVDEIHEKYGLYYIHEDDIVEQVRQAKPLNKNRFCRDQLNYELWKFWSKHTWKELFPDS